MLEKPLTEWINIMIQTKQPRPQTVAIVAAVKLTSREDESLLYPAHQLHTVILTALLLLQQTPQ